MSILESEYPPMMHSSMLSAAPDSVAMAEMLKERITFALGNTILYCVKLMARGHGRRESIA